MTIESRSRRHWLKTALPAVAGLPLFGGALVASSGCSKAKAFSCSGTTGLDPEQTQLRLKLAYTDKAPKPELVCRNCIQYVEAADDGCGACKVMPGPTHPSGYCRVFQAKS